MNVTLMQAGNLNIEPYQTLIYCTAVLALLGVNWFIIQYAGKRKWSRGIFFGNLLNIIRQTTLPCALYSKNNLQLCYFNSAFASIWKIRHPTFLTAKGLFTPGEPLLLAGLAKIRTQSTPIFVEHVVGSGPDQIFFKSTLESFDEGEGYIMQTMQDVTELKSNIELLQAEISEKKSEIALCTNELLLIGQELELSYIKVENANMRLLKILEQMPANAEIENVGHWTLDLTKMEIELSKEARRILGIAEIKNIALSRILELFDRQHDNDLTEAYNKIITGTVSVYNNLKISSADGQGAKWIECSTSVAMRRKGRPQRLKGIFILSEVNDNTI